MNPRILLWMGLLFLAWLNFDAWMKDYGRAATEPAPAAIPAPGAPGASPQDDLAAELPTIAGDAVPAAAPPAPAAAAAAAAAKAASQVAYGGTTDGSVIYESLCGACHTGGVGGAPTLDHGHWDARIAQGTDTLYTHAIEGFTGAAGVMPARGGNPALTDEQMKATVDWMLANLK